MQRAYSTPEPLQITGMKCGSANQTVDIITSKLIYLEKCAKRETSLIAFERGVLLLIITEAMFN
jgi:hypothetical protein